MVTREEVLQARSTIRDPDLGRDIVSLGMVKELGECGRRHHPFSTGGAEAKSAEIGIPFLGTLPLDDEIREGADTGRPAAAVVGSPQQAAFRELARKLAAQISVRAYRRLPVIQVR